MATDVTGAILNDPVTSERVPIDYLKSAQFRNVHVDGVIGSVTPSGHIHVATFCERPALPRRMVHHPNPDGTLGDAIPEETVSRGSIVRDMEVDLFFTPEVAKELRDWLTGRLDDIEQRKASLGGGNNNV